MTEQSDGGARGGGWMRYMPLAAFAAVAVVFAIQLSSPPTGNLPSQLIAKPAPELNLPLLGGDGQLSAADFDANGVTVLNYWASWCGPCRIEHPKLMELSEREGVTMLGVAYHDKPAAAASFLQRLGDPFDKVGLDESGEAALRWGVEGVPETYIINGQGQVVYKHTGPIQNDDLTVKILPAIERARSGG